MLPTWYWVVVVGCSLAAIGVNWLGVYLERREQRRIAEFHAMLPILKAYLIGRRS